MPQRGATIPQRTIGAADAQRLQQVAGRLARLLRAGTAGVLTPSQLSCLAGIVHDGPLRVSALAARDAINPTALSRILARLQESGLVTRTPDPTDGRVSLLSATAQGRRVLDRMRAARSELLDEAARELSREQLDALVAALPALEALGSALARTRTTTTTTTPTTTTAPTTTATTTTPNEPA